MSAEEKAAERLRVLVVEDDEDDFYLFHKALEQIDGGKFDVTRAATFDDGLAAIRAGGYDVCFLDFRLGVRDGVELLREAQRFGAPGPFIMLTGMSDRRTDLEAMRAGAADYLVKDQVTPDVLERAVRYGLERERAAAQLRRARDELEHRVAERTAELSVTIKELRAREVSERQAREAAERLYEDARQASRLKDEFLASLSHELRTPMNSILGYTQLMLRKEYDDDSELFNWLEVVYRNSKAQMRLIEDLLDVSRIVTGKLTIASAPVDLAALVRDIAASMHVLADERKQRLDVEIKARLGLVLGDQTRLEQVVSNLLSNAIKFTPEGGTIKVSLDRDELGNARLCVKDDGQGIAPEFLPHVFDRFRQEDGRMTRRHGGLGLGLSLVSHFVAAHGGTVKAESEGPGKGSTFTVTLPAQGTPKPAEEPATESADAPVRKEKPLLGARVLVIDDSADVRLYAVSVLRRMGAEATAVSSAEEARAAVAQGDFDAILCDIAMPDEDGYSFVRKLRAGSNGKSRIPAAAMTAFARKEEKDQALEAGFDLHLTKPMTAASITQTVSELMALRGFARPATDQPTPGAP